jgi:hypothetical protein
VIVAGDHFGTTSSSNACVWQFDGATAIRVGVPNPDHLSTAVLANGETLREALARVPMFSNKRFVLHRMTLPPGAYHPRIARPVDQHPKDFPGGHWEAGLSHALIATLNQMRSLVGMLDEVFQSVHPAAENMDCYGAATRNLIILACTECEAQWRAVLLANGYPQLRPTTSDFVKLMPAMRLDKYCVTLRHAPWLAPVAPFKGWATAAPTQSLPWYNDYNAVKHDRETAFDRATLANAISAVAAVWIMVAAQFGGRGMREFDDLSRYFQLVQVPTWRYSDVYTYGYAGFTDNGGPKPYAF